MTSQTSSAKSKIAFYDLRYSFKKTFGVPLLLLVMLFLTLTMSQMDYSKSRTGIIKKGFILVSDYEISWPVIIILFIGGMLTALSTFHFINSVKKTNVFLSMNISRKTIFRNRCLTSVIYLFFAVAIPFSVNLFYSISNFGYTPEIITAWIYLLLGMLACVYAAFSITTLAMTFAGNILESVLYAGTFLATPTVLFLGIEMLMGKYLNGFMCTVFKAESFSPLYLENGGLLLNTRIINPFFFFDNLDSYIINNGLLNHGIYSAYEGNTFNISTLEYGSIFLWLALSAAFIFVAVHSFNKRKAENASCNGTNKIAAIYTVTVVMFGAFALCASLFHTNKLITLLISVLISAAAFIVVNILIFRNKKETFKAVKKLPVHLGAFILLSIVFMTGCFGYSKALPELNEIEEAFVTSPINDKLFFGGSAVTGWGGSNNVLTEIRGYMEMTGGFTSENDLKKILSIHENVIETKTATEKTDFCIVYKLKNGKIMKRCFETISDENYESILSLADSDFCREVLTKKLSATDEELIDFCDKIEADYYSNTYDAYANYEYEFWRNFYMTLKYQKAGMYYIFNKNGTQSDKALSELLTEADYINLKKCILDDMYNMNLTERYLPQSKVLGMIPFASAEAFNTHMNTNWFSDNVFNQSNIIITADMSKTLAFLAENDMMKYFENNKEIASVRIMPFSEAKSTLYSMTYNKQFGRLFSIEGAISEETYYSSMDESDNTDAFDSITPITNTDKLAKLYEVSYPFASVDEDGFIAEYVFADGSSVRLYIPADYADLVK